MTACSRATPTASRSPSTRPPARSADATRTDISPALVGSFKLPDGRNARPSFALIAERFLSDEYVPDKVAAATGDPGRDDPAHRPRTGAGRVRAAGHARHAVDRLRRPPPREDRRASGVDARHARHLGAFQRLPDLPDAAPAANPARLDRLPRRLPLQGAVPAADAAAQPAGARRAEPGHAAEGRAARLPAGAGGSAGRRRRQRRSASTRPIPGTRRSPPTA